MAARAATQALALKAIRFPNSIAWAGTSKQAAQYLDPPQNNKGNAGWMNWTAGWLRAQGKSLITLGNFGVSGTRTDQFNVAAAIATGASIIGLGDPTNDFAQQYPAAGTVVATAFANQKAQIKQINDAGAVCLYVWECGAENFSATMIGNTIDFLRLMADFMQYGDGDGRGPPNMVFLDGTPVLLNTAATASIDLLNTQDGTHNNIVAAQKFGLYAVPKIAPLLREIPGHRMRCALQSATYGTRNIWNSPGMTGAVAAAGTGNTGTVPTNAGAAQTGLATAVYSTQATSADADGNTWGNETKIVATATGAGTVSLIFALFKNNIVPGSIVRGSIEVDVSAATGLQNVSANLESFPTSGGPTATYDMIDSTLGTDPGGYTNFVLEPPPLVFGNFVGSPFTNLAVRVKFSAAGSATILVRKGLAELATA